MFTTVKMLTKSLLRISSCKNLTKRLCSRSPALPAEYQPSKDQWDPETLTLLQESLRILPNFINETEEHNLMQEVEPHLKRLVYERDHWDEAIVDFRETERKHWNANNSVIIEKLRQTAFKVQDKHLPYVHVLDLAEKGHIKPHIDSSRFCGDTVAVLSLLSDSILKLVHDEHKDFSVKYLIPKRSLYVMTGSSRYDYTHEILDNASSFINDAQVFKTRRISIVCRNEVK